MNYIFDQLNHQIDEIISHYNLSRNPALQLISVIMNYIIGDTRLSCGLDKKEDIYKFIQIMKNHLKNDPKLRMSLYNTDSAIKETDLTPKDLDIHYKCKIELNEIRQKIKNRESKLTDTTFTYLKDLQALREQLYRQSNNLSTDVFDQRNFDSFEIVDPKYREMLNSKINVLKQDYEQKIKYLTQIAESQKKEIGTLKCQLQDLQYRSEYYDDPEYLIRKLFHLQRDPYELWRLIQDNQGNTFFFQVFRDQKKGYGIDYAEIDKLLMAVNVQEREFERYKQALDSQLGSFTERILQDVYDLRQQALDKESELDTYNKKYIRNLTVLNKIILRLLNQITSTYNSLLLKTSLKVWKNQDLKLSEVLQEISKFSIKQIDHDLMDYFIQQIHSMQDKIAFQEVKINGQKFLIKSLETKYSIISNTLIQFKSHFNIRNIDIDLEQKLLKLDNFQIRFSQELLNQLMFQKLTYAKYLEQISKFDKYVQTEESDIVEANLQTKEIIVENVRLTTYIKEKYQEKKEKLHNQTQNYSNRISPTKEFYKMNQNSNLENLRQGKQLSINENKFSFKLQQSDTSGEQQQDQLSAPESLKGSYHKPEKIAPKPKIKFKTDILNQQLVDPSCRSFEQDNMKPIFNDEEIQFEQIDSNLLFPNQTNLLPQLKTHREIKKNLIKQLKHTSQAQYESEIDKPKKKQEQKKKNKKNQNIVIKYEDYPKYEKSENDEVYLFSNVQHLPRMNKNKNKLTQFIYKI